MFLCLTQVGSINMELLMLPHICFSNKKNIKNIFTRVLKGHIAVANSNLNSRSNGGIDTKQKILKEINLDYEHGTGHGVVFFQMYMRDHKQFQN